jgi:integrase
MQISKLAKGLNRFSVNDISIMLDFPEDEIKEALFELAEEDVIKKLGEKQYLYIKLKNNKELMQSKNSEKLFKKITFETDKIKNVNPVELFDKEEELKKYEAAPEWAKPRLIRYISLIKLTAGFKGKYLQMYLEQIAKINPKFKTSYSSLKRFDRLYREGGVSALIPNFGNNVNKTVLDKEMYEYFKELYLSPERFSLKKCLKLVSEDERFKYAIIPSGITFRRILYKEYKQNEVEQIRNRRIILPELPKLEQKVEIVLKNKKASKIFLKYIDAVNYYMKSKAFLNQDKNRKATQKSYFKTHLNPFFKNLNFDEITQEKVNEFQNTKIKEGLALTSISRIFALLSKITNLYSPCGKLFVLTGENKVGNIACQQILTVEQINKILKIKDNIKLLLMFTLSFGISQAEALGLEYDDIDFKLKTIKINKIFYRNKLEKYRCAYQLRKFMVPDNLLKQISKNKTGRIFKFTPEELDNKISEIGIKQGIMALNYDDFRNTHVKMLIDNNISINIISGNLAFNDIRDFIKKYQNFIPQKMPRDFDLLKMYISSN